MRNLFVIIIFTGLFVSCEPTRRAAPFIPPGEKLGKTWDQAEDYGYENEVYVIPSYITYPLKGNRNFRVAIHRAYREDVCKNGPREATVQYVVSEEGQIMNVHPITGLEQKCADVIRETMQEFEFFPAEHENKRVKMLMAYTFSRDRL